MTIKEVCDQYDVAPDTLRYYERIGVIPRVGRTAGGIRNYTQEDLGWVAMAVCFRNAGMPLDLLIEYVRLTREGEHTLGARLDLLKEARKRVLSEREKCDAAIFRLDKKIEKYEEAVRTGRPVWEEGEQCPNES